jgi:hypothetical protein
LKYRIEAGTRAYWLPQYRFGAVPAAAARAAAGFAASAAASISANCAASLGEG